MMNKHVDNADMIAFVLGVLPFGRYAAFEAHVSTCQQCAARLRREASLELGLLELASARLGQEASPERSPQPVVVAKRRMGVRRWLPALAVIALLCAGLWPNTAPLAAAPVTPVICADGPDQGTCIRQAHRAGLIVQYPRSAGPPRMGEYGPSADSSLAPRSHP